MIDPFTPMVFFVYSQAACTTGIGTAVLRLQILFSLFSLLVIDQFTPVIDCRAFCIHVSWLKWDRFTRCLPLCIHRLLAAGTTGIGTSVLRFQSLYLWIYIYVYILFYSRNKTKLVLDPFIPYRPFIHRRRARLASALRCFVCRATFRFLFFLYACSLLVIYLFTPYRSLWIHRRPARQASVQRCFVCRASSRWRGLSTRARRQRRSCRTWPTWLDWGYGAKVHYTINRPVHVEKKPSLTWELSQAHTHDGSR